jgi:hypothetical protein
MDRNSLDLKIEEFCFCKRSDQVVDAGGCRKRKSADDLGLVLEDQKVY